MNFLVRAKTIKQDFMEETDSLKCIDGEWYAIGDYFGDKKTPVIVVHSYTDLNSDGGMYIQCYAIHKDTRAIHFEDMIDSEGNKIFASLSSDGKGGDIVEDTLLNIEYDEWKIKSKMIFDNVNCQVLAKNFFERVKKKSDEFATEQKPKVLWSQFIDLTRPRVIGIQT